MQSAIRSYVLVLIMKCILLPFAYILTSDRGKTNIVRVGYLTAVQLLMVGGLVGDLLAFHAQTTLTSNISAINPFKKEAHATHMHALCM